MNTTDILANLKIERLNPMQEAVGKAYAENKNLVVLSPTGSGKTLAFLLLLVQSLSPDVDVPQAVVLVPSRELALQIEGVFKSMNTFLRVMSCYGGRPTMDEHRTMRSLKPQVIIGTPGRMNDHLGKGNIEVETLRTLVIDEFDKCLEFGFQEEMSQVLAKLPALSRRVLLSATDCEEIPLFTGMDRMVKLDFLGEGNLAERLDLRIVRSPEKDKLDTLYRLLCTLGEGSTLVFVNYRESVERVVAYLKSRKFPCDAFHGGMEVERVAAVLLKKHQRGVGIPRGAGGGSAVGARCGGDAETDAVGRPLVAPLSPGDRGVAVADGDSFETFVVRRQLFIDPLPVGIGRCAGVGTPALPVGFCPPILGSLLCALRGGVFLSVSR